MYILNYIKLAEDLRDNKVSEKQQFHYLIGTTIIFGIIYASRLLPYEGDIKIALLTDIISLLLMIIGLIVIYRKNQQWDGKHFIERYLCLWFPISIVGFFIWVLIGGITIAIILMIFGQEGMKDGNIMWVFNITSGLLGTLFILFLFYHGMIIASNQKK